ncbi:hypothetical protein OKW42_001010 [Paraburkholderia sp. WC7.3d]
MDRGQSADQPGRRSAYQVTTCQGHLGRARTRLGTANIGDAFARIVVWVLRNDPTCTGSDPPNISGLGARFRTCELTGRISDYKHIRSGRDKVGGAQHLISGAGEIADYGRSYCPPEIATLHHCPKRKALLLSAVRNGGLPKALDLPFIWPSTSAASTLMHAGTDGRSDIERVFFERAMSGIIASSHASQPYFAVAAALARALCNFL